uniref:Putative secreted protein n=1 Tax=Anopheles darlingi TaxID=43151 RepID=A0A2M4D6Z5_ANODA
MWIRSEGFLVIVSALVSLLLRSRTLQIESVRLGTALIMGGCFVVNRWFAPLSLERETTLQGISITD